MVKTFFLHTSGARAGLQQCTIYINSTKKRFVKSTPRIILEIHLPTLPLCSVHCALCKCITPPLRLQTGKTLKGYQVLLKCHKGRTWSALQYRPNYVFFLCLLQLGKVILISSELLFLGHAWCRPKIFIYYRPFQLCSEKNQDLKAKTK